MASVERSQLIGLELTIESQVKGLSHGQASRVRTKIWGAMVREAKGIDNLIQSHSRIMSSHPVTQSVKTENF